MRFRTLITSGGGEGDGERGGAARRRRRRRRRRRQGAGSREQGRSLKGGGKPRNEKPRRLYHRRSFAQRRAINAASWIRRERGGREGKKRERERERVGGVGRRGRNVIPLLRHARVVSRADKCATCSSQPNNRRAPHSAFHREPPKSGGAVRLP
jgi:hypothetical protein